MTEHTCSRRRILVSVLVVALAVAPVGTAAGTGTMALTEGTALEHTMQAGSSDLGTVGASALSSAYASTDEVEFVSAEEEASTSDDYEVPAPDGIQEGDLLIMTIGGTDGEPKSQANDGWTRFAICGQDNNADEDCPADGEDLYLHMYYKVASDDEPSEYDVDADHNTVASVIALRGADTSDPIESVSLLPLDDSEDVSTCPSTEGVDGGMLLCGFTHDDRHELENYGDLTLRTEDFNGDSSTQVATKQLNDGGDTDVHTPDHVDPSGNKDINIAAVVRPSGSGGDDGGNDDGGDDGGDDGELLGNNLVYGGTSEMTQGDYLESSNGDYRLKLQGDGNLVLRETGSGDAQWASGTADDGGTHVKVQSDGNFVLYTDSSDPVWASDTPDSGANELLLEDDGALVLYADGSAVWSVNGTPSNGGGDDGGSDGGQAPTASIGTVDEDYENYIRLDASGSSDPDGGSVSYEWSISNGEFYRSDSDTVEQPWIDITNTDQLTATLTVTDDEGDTATAERTFDFGGGGSDDGGSDDDSSDGSKTVSEGTYNLVNVESGMVLEAQDGNTDNGASIHQDDEDGGANQAWQVDYLGDGEYGLLAQHSDKAADVSRASTDDNADIHQWGWHGGNNQRWYIDALGNGEYRVRSVNSDKAMEVADGQTGEDANVHQDSWDGGANQKWRFESADSSDGGSDGGSDGDSDDGDVAEGSWGIVAIPDTQDLDDADTVQYLDSMTDWVVNNEDERNIAFVTHEGDMVSNGDDGEELDNVDSAMSDLDGVVPWSPGVGNHDFADTGVRSSGAQQWKEHFGASRFQGRSYFGGASDNGRNFYQTFSAGGHEFLHLSLEWEAPGDPDEPGTPIGWAQDVMDEHPNKPTIITTHSYLTDEPRERKQDVEEANGYGNSGQEMWEKLVRPNPQVFMTLNGHEHHANDGNDGEYHQVSTNAAGKKVYEMLANYQDYPENADQSWFRRIRFVPGGGDSAPDRIKVMTYSAYKDEYQTDSRSEFSFDLDFDSRFSVSGDGGDGGSDDGGSDDGDSGQAPTARIGTVDEDYENWMRLDASGSSDPDGGSVSYEWEVSGGSIWEDSSDTDEQPWVDISNTDQVTATLTVTDDEGQTATAERTFDFGGGGNDGDSGESFGNNLVDEMSQGDWLESSNGDYRLSLQSDGNLVLRETSSGDAQWASGTAGDGATRVTMQGDGNLVMYTSNGDAVWASHTASSGANELLLEDDGALVLYDDESSVWSVNGEPSNDASNDGSDSADGDSGTDDGQSPYGGSAQSLTDRVQAEDFDTGGEGVAYHDLDSSNSGGAYRQTGVDIERRAATPNVGWIQDGEWLEYTVTVENSGTHDLTARVASGSDGGAFRVLVDGQDRTGTVEFDGTGGYGAWTTVTAENVDLSAGQHTVRLVAVGHSYGWNIDWFQADATEDATGTEDTSDSDGSSDDGSSDDSGTDDTSQTVSEGTYKLVNVNSGKVLDIEGTSTSNGASALQWAWADVTWQRWQIDYLGDGEYRIINKHSNNVLDVEGVSTDDGADIHQWEWVNGANQKWRIEEVDDGEYRIESVHSGKVLDVSGASTDDSANIHQWSWHGGDNQRWRLEPVN